MGLRDKVAKADMVEEKNRYLQEPQAGLELCANIISIGKMKFEKDLDIIDEVINEFADISHNDSNTTGVKTMHNFKI